MVPKCPTTSFVLQNTDFRTNWLTPQVVIMHRGVQIEEASPLIPDQGLCPWSPLRDLSAEPRYHHVPPNSDPECASDGRGAYILSMVSLACLCQHY